MGHVSLTTPIWGEFVISRLVLDIAYLNIKYEDWLRPFICYMMKDIKHKSSDDLGWLGSLKVIGIVNSPWGTHDFLFTFYRNYAYTVYVLYRFWDIVSHLSQVANFSYLSIFDSASVGMNPFGILPSRPLASQSKSQDYRAAFAWWKSRFDVIVIIA